MKITPNVISQLAREVDITDPIDWGCLVINEDSTYNMMALSVMEMVQMMEQDDEQKTQTVLMASLTKLLVENFVLNTKLREING